MAQTVILTKLYIGENVADLVNIYSYHLLCTCVVLLFSYNMCCLMCCHLFSLFTLLLFDHIFPLRLPLINALQWNEHITVQLLLTTPKLNIFCLMLCFQAFTRLDLIKYYISTRLCDGEVQLWDLHLEFVQMRGWQLHWILGCLYHQSEKLSEIYESQLAQNNKCTVWCRVNLCNKTNLRTVKSGLNSDSIMGPKTMKWEVGIRKSWS